jgi:endoribonuclease Dicer
MLCDTTLVVRFLNGHINVLMASDVLEEGIDIQKCNLIVKFDMPKNYRSYVQSKGRARFRTSNYVMIVPKDMEPTFNIKCASYKATENALQMVSTI